MTAIVCNTLLGAVTEYTGHAFQSITPTHAGSSAGLFEFGGDTDDGALIVSDIRLPSTLRETTLKQAIEMVYVSAVGSGCMRFTVHGARHSWAYSFPLRPSGQTRCQPGRGIRENYLGFSLSNPAGQAFSLDRVEILNIASKTRRV